MSKFKVGDRVRFYQKYGEDGQGALVAFDSNSSLGPVWAVDRGPGFKGHSCQGALSTNTGWWVNEDDMTLVEEAAPVPQPAEEQKGMTANTSGMLKETVGKLAIWRFPPEWAVYLGAHMAKGGEKGYPLNNWRKPGKASELAEPLLRHVLDWLCGNDVDPKDGSNVLDAIACNAMMLRSKQTAGTLVDDRLEGPQRPSPESIKAILYPLATTKKSG